MREIILVEWTDCISYDSWDDFSEHEDLELPTILSVGFLIKETDDKVILSSLVDDENEQMGMSQAIPKAVIKSMKRIF